MELTEAESKVTYEDIKAYMKEQTGLQVSNLYIIQVMAMKVQMEQNIPDTWIW